MNGARTMARLARTVVSGAGAGHLIVTAAIGAAPERIACGVIDHDGEPLLAVRPDDSAAWAARVGRLARLELAPVDNVHACLTGRLTLVEPGRELDGAGRWQARILEAYRRDGSVLARLSVEAVSLGRADGLSPRHRVGLHDYAEAEPDVVIAHGRRVLEHLNHGHEAAIRLAAHLLDVDPQALVAAHLNGLDASGVDLWAFDGLGAESRRLSFSQPVTDLDQLAAALRGVLAGRRATR